MPSDATIFAGAPAEEKTASPRFWSLHSHTGLQLAGTHLRMIQVPASEFMDKTQNNSRSSLLGIFINILLPVLILDYCSAGPANPLERPAGESFWHIGPVWALVFALSLPLVYGIRSLVVTRKFDLMSGVGMAGVLLTGVISIFVIGPEGRIHSATPWLFAGKEALIPLILAAAVVVIVLIPGVIPYAMSRIQHWRDPWIDPQGKGFQTIQSLYAIGSGGLMGVGIGNSRQKHLYLPEPQNDFIFSVVCEELGFIGATLIILVFVLLIWRGYVIAMRCRDRFGSMLAIGLTTQVGVQTILNIAVVSNTIPNTGISLPFFSSGGTALVMLLAEMGVILSVSRQTNLEKE